MSSLSHHGIKGQRWGVRRFQNADGTRTAAGKKRYSVEAVDVNSSRKEIKKLVGDFSEKDKDFFFGEKHSYGYGDYDHDGNKVAKRFVIKEGKNIVAFIDAERGDHHNDTLNIVVGTAQSARGKGYASILSKTMVNWYEAEGYENASMLEWNVNKDNIGSRKAAEKAGFKEVLGDDDVGYRYSKNAKKELDELSKARMKVKEIDKEVSDKINSDFKKTKLSKISPNTTITPYGEGMTDWNSELGFYKSMIVDRHASKWAKKHHSEDIARYDKATSDWSSAYETFDKKRRRIKHTSIVGTMYIEGNALILGDSSYLEHHGIKGQRWGVRRFQNKDGTRTAAGKAREDRRVLKKGSMVYRVHAAPKDHVYDNKKYVSTNIEDHNKWADYFGNEYAIRWKPVYYQRYKTKKDLYVATGKDIVDVVSTKLDKQMVKRDLDSLEKEVKLRGYDWDNTSKEDHYSMLLGAQKESGKQIVHELQKMGFGAIEDDHGKNVAKDPVIVLDPDKKLRRYGKTAKDTRYLESYRKAFNEFFATHTSIGGTMYIEGNALILGDSSYLEHHGIKGQRWGVRRFQNRDGSLTNAGRKRLGYATKGAAQTVGKAFKAGVKAGGKAVKAVKAHHEAAEAKKKEKKKEKASKTRLGVMANKDLFTNEEIRKLNERFKLEDEMKMATLQKGVEIAKAVGTIAQNVGTMAKAYEDVTGQSLSPIKRKAAEEKAKQDAEDRKRKLAKEDAETKRAEDKEKRDIEDRERRIKFEDEDRVRKQAKEDADAQRAENAEKRAQAKEQRDSSMAVELQRKAKAAADEQEHKAVKAKAESRSAILDVLEKIDKIQDHDDDDHNNPPGGGIDTWDDDDYLNFFKKTGIIHSDISDPSIIQNGVLFIDSSDSLAHHGVKGQRWGVRRFQNPDGTLTDKGRKHYEKAIEKLDRKQTHSDALRGRLERQHPFAVTGSAILGAVAAGMSIAATGGASVAAIAAGSAISAAVNAGITHASYSVSEAWEGRGTKRRQKKRKEYEEMLNHDGMYHVENGTLFINAGEPYLEHHGVLGMKWGKHLRAGKGPVDGEAGAGGGAGEDDEKLKEMAKKAGMSVAEYKQKFASKIGGAAAKAKKEIGYAYGSEYKKDFEKAARLHENNSKSMHAQAKAAWEGYGESRTAAQKDNWKRYAEYDRQAKASGNMFVKRERSKRAYDNSLASKVDSVKRKARLTQDKAKSKISDAVDAAKKTKDDVKSNIRSKTGIGVKKDIERNARLAEGQKKRAHELTKQVYSAKNKEDWARAYSESNKESFKALDNERKVKKDTKSYPKSIAGRVDSTKRKARLTKDRLKSALGKSKQRKQLSTEGPKAKKQISNARDSVEKAARANEAAYKHAKAVYRQTGSDSDAYKQAIKRSGTTLQRYIDSKKLLEKKKRAKHSDDTDAIYTEGTRLVIASKWG